MCSKFNCIYVRLLYTVHTVNLAQKPDIYLGIGSNRDLLGLEAETVIFGTVVLTTANSTYLQYLLFAEVLPSPVDKERVSLVLYSPVLQPVVPLL